MFQPPRGTPDGWGIWGKSSMQSIAGVMMEGEPEGCTDSTDTKHEIGQITKTGGDYKSLCRIPSGCYTGTRAEGFPLGGRRVIRLDLAAATRTRIFARPQGHPNSEAWERDFQTPRDACANLRWAGRSTQAVIAALT
jgi:hypothetical protein